MTNGTNGMETLSIDLKGLVAALRGLQSAFLTTATEPHRTKSWDEVDGSIQVMQAVLDQIKRVAETGRALFPDGR
jgi:hypothetical protein